MKGTQTDKPGKRSIEVVIQEQSSGNPVCNAKVYLYAVSADLSQHLDWETLQTQEVRAHGRTDGQGEYRFERLTPGKYIILYAHLPPMPPCQVTLGARKDETVVLKPDFDVHIKVEALHARGKTRPGFATAGDTLLLTPEYHYSGKVGIRAENPLVQPDRQGRFQSRPATAGTLDCHFTFSVPPIFHPAAFGGNQTVLPESASGAQERQGQNASFTVNKEITIMSSDPTQPLSVRLGRSESSPTDDTAFWAKIKSSTEALSYDNYQAVIDALISPPVGGGDARLIGRIAALNEVRGISFTNGDAYRLLKTATEAFVMVNTGVAGGFDLTEAEKEYMALRDVGEPDDGAAGTPGDSAFERYSSDSKMLPYLSIIRHKMPEVSVAQASANPYSTHLGYQLIQEKLRYPCMLELIWSYWHEEGMLVQTMNAITRRFQNVRSPNGNDPLANLEIDPLRPLNNIIWGYTQDEQNRLSVVRRNYEYDHHYGLRLEGKAVQGFRPVDTRSKFLEAFHHLLRMCSMFYKQDDDTTVKADAFPVLNALKEVHLILSQGAHNQYGDLPSSARIEMLMQQWMLARPEFRDFLPTRMMVAYPEPWMDRVDAMKKLQGWSDTSVIHFRSLAMFGEQLLLSVRFGAWSDVVEPAQAFNWARYWRPQAQGYIHAYRAATGVDLTGAAVDTIVDATMPSVLLKRRLAAQHQRAA